MRIANRYISFFSTFVTRASVHTAETKFFIKEAMRSVLQQEFVSAVRELFSFRLAVK